MSVWFRSIAARMICVVAVLCGGFVLISWWELAALHHRMENLRHEAEQQAAEHLDGLLELEAQPVRAFAASGSKWDALVVAIESADQRWLTANLDPGLEDHRLDAAIVIDAASRPVHAAGLDPAAVQRLVSSLDLVGLRAARTTWLHTLVDGVPADIACATIHPASDRRRSEPRGLLLAVRLWTTGRAARFFGGTLVLGQVEGDAEVAHGPEGILIRKTLSDDRGHALATLEVRQATPALAVLDAQAVTHLAISVVYGAFTLLVLGLAGLLLIGRPLKRLATCAAHQDALSARTLARRQDEFGQVALVVAQSIEQQSHLSAEVGQRRQAEEWLREANAQLSADLQRREQAEQALREAEMRNALALQGGNLCLWELFMQEGRWSTDRSWFALLGVTLDPSVTDTAAWEAVVAPEGLKDLRDRIASIRAEESQQIESTFRVQQDDGGRVWVLLRGMVVERTADGKPARLAGTMQDVTRWREMEEQLRQSQKLESIGQLAAGIAHEINTPIQFIGDNARFATDSFATLMAFALDQAAMAASHPDPAVRARVAAATETADIAYLTAEVPKALEQTIEGVDRVATIVRAMKEFSHPGSAELSPCDLNHLITNAVVISRNTWKYVADLSTELDPALPLVPLAAGDFNQVLLNLIVNAAQAVEDAQKKLGKTTQGRIVISTTRAGDNAVFKISDDGCGIPEEIRERIYDPFFTTKEVGRGSGQGLTITRSVIVDRHHGSIACTSTVGIGTTFSITLPLIHPEA